MTDSRKTAPPRTHSSEHIPLPVELERGTPVGRYLILERASGDGRGVVYSAYDPDLDRKIALKVLAPAQEGTPQSTLLREAKAMGRLSHPNVLTVYDVGAYREGVFLAMELVNGPSLKEWLEAAPRSWEAIVRLFRQAGEGLSAAHSAGLVHRDFRPESVKLRGDGTALVTDFALARGLESLELAPRSPRAPGSPEFMAPELLLGTQVDARSDQFSFCVALHHALFDRPLSPPPPAWLKRVLARGLSAAPEARYPSLRALLHAMAKEGGRRTLLRRVGLALVGSAVVGAAVGLALPSVSRCGRRGTAGLADVWNPQQRRQIAGHFGPASDGVLAALDRQRGEWLEADRALCESAPSLSAAVVAERESCLERAKQQLAVVVEQLAAGNRQVLEHVAGSPQALLNSGECTRAPAAGTTPPLPAPHELARVLDLRRSLQRARALIELGRNSEARSALTPVLEEADAFPRLPLGAEALLLEGLLLSKESRQVEARAGLREAAYAAERVGDDRTAAESWTALARQLMAGKMDLPEASRALQQAEASLQRGQLPSSLRAAHLDATGRLNLASGRFGAAARAFERAADEHGADRPGAIQALSFAARAEWERGRYEDAVRLAERALRTGASLESLILLGASRVATGQEEAAAEALDRAVKALSGTTTVAWDLLPLLATTLRELGRSADAQTVAAQLWRRDPGGAHRAEILALEASAAESVGNLDHARTRLVEAMGLLDESLPGRHPHRAGVRIRLAAVELSAGALARAEEQLEAARRTLAAAEDDGQRWSSELSFQEARLALRQGQPRAAIARLEALRAGAEEFRRRWLVQLELSAAVRALPGGSARSRALFDEAMAQLARTCDAQELKALQAALPRR